MTKLRIIPLGPMMVLLAACSPDAGSTANAQKGSSAVQLLAPAPSPAPSPAESLVKVGVPMRGEWQAHSTNAQALGAVSVDAGRIRFEKGPAFELKSAGGYFMLSPTGRDRGAGHICGDLAPVAVSFALRSTEADPRTLTIEFFRAPPGPNPDFQPYLCERFNYLPQSIDRAR